MVGALIGDYVGSPYEALNATKDAPLFDFRRERFTDDSVLTVAIAAGLLQAKERNGLSDGTVLRECVVSSILDYGERYPNCGFGFFFRKWLTGATNYLPYNSFGNGAGMRISPVGWMAKGEEEVRFLSRACTDVTHNHPEGIKGAEAIAMCVYLARNGRTKLELHDLVKRDYYPDIDAPVLYPLPCFGKDFSTCQKTVPVAINAFLASSDEKDAIERAVLCGGDSDTIACMTGSIAEAFYQPRKTSELERSYFPRFPGEFRDVIRRFHRVFETGKEF